LAAARNNVPAVYPVSDYARDGGLLSYGVDQVDTWRRAATYVDRILRGEKPGDLPVQFPTKYVAHSTAKCNGESFGVEENLTRSSVAEYLSGARVEFILDPLDIGI
jgi:putative ABC transport system substrate-binding protein